MQFSFGAVDSKAVKSDLLVVVSGASTDWKEALTHRLEADTIKSLAALAKRREFTGKAGQKFSAAAALGNTAVEVVVIGSGESFTTQKFLDLGGDIAREANRLKAKSADVLLGDLGRSADEVASLLVRGAHLGSYRYTPYKTEKAAAHSLKKVRLTFLAEEKVSSSALSKAATRATVIAEGVMHARSLVNMPPADLYPDSFAKEAAKMAKSAGLKLKVFKEAELKKMKMNLLLGVGQGSVRPPRLIHFTYEPASAKDKKKKPIVLVGKGITFDSGGLSLKPSAAMLDMKIDMGGAAAVFGAMYVVGKLKPNRPVHGLLSCAENMPSGNAIKLGDVIKGASGRTVEINNTDAEGRLVLADALNYACGLKPERIIDLATLTGAIMVALGPHTVGLYANDEGLAGDLLASSELAGEHLWRMPLTEGLKDQLKSDIADTKNTGERFGGSITAALFLQEFIQGTPWAHLDIAGPASGSADSGAKTRGGSGVGVATLAELLLN